MTTLSLGDNVHVTISELNFAGDGVAYNHDVKVIIPYTCAGDAVTATVTHIHKHYHVAKLDAIITPSPQRNAPPCKHYTHCGGCTLQHLSDTTIQNFKQDKLHQLLSRLGLSNDEALRIARPLISAGMASRRRIDLACNVAKSGEITLGFHAAGTPNIIHITECPIAIPAITSLLSPLQETIRAMKQGRSMRGVAIQDVNDHTLEILLSVSKDLSEDDRILWRSFAATHTITRIAEQRIDHQANIQSTRILVGDTPYTLLSGKPVEVPVGAFMQAAKIGQDSLTDFVLEHTLDARHIIDFYSGIGTYSLPLALRGASVHAYEGSESMVQALQNAARHANLESHLQATTRDLFRNIVKPEEMQNADAIVINPPRNGAEPQTKAIAKSDARKVVMVSCNPVTCERDCRSLIQAGYRITDAMAVDQFVMSEHVEIALAFEK